MELVQKAKDRKIEQHREKENNDAQRLYAAAKREKRKNVMEICNAFLSLSQWQFLFDEKAAVPVVCRYA